MYTVPINVEINLDVIKEKQLSGINEEDVLCRLLVICFLTISTISSSLSLA